MLTKAEIARIRSLGEKKGRLAEGLFVVEGRKMVAEADASGLRVDGVYATEEMADGFRGSTVVSGAQFSRISRLRSPQGVLALVQIPAYGLPVPRGGELVLALDCVQDPGNLGTIVRVADWFGVRDVVCSHDTADCYNPKTVQATMGSIFRVRVHYTDLARWLAPVTVPVSGAFMDGVSIYGAGAPAEGVLVMGNEGSGISPGVEKYVTRRVSIPPYPAGGGGAESLNVAVAAAVILSEMRRVGSRK